LTNPDNELIESHRLLVCLGAGGVGKTTVSASLAVKAALLGHATDVMTVDPAPRLLDALGLDADAHEPRRVHLRADKSRKDQGHPGRLRALKLDPKRTFDAIVTRHAPSEAARDAILKNGIYRNLSSALAGVGDYMAMERLLELSADTKTRTIVLDTPPAAEAIDFLDAPRRLLELLNSRAIVLLSAPGGIFRSQLKLVDLAARAVLAAFDRVTGLDLLSDVQQFVQSFDGMYSGFAERAERARNLIRATDTAIVVVTTAEAGPIAQAIEFVTALKNAGLTLSAVIVNRVMTDLPDDSDLDTVKLPAGLKRKLRRNLADYRALKYREQSSLEALRDAIPENARIMVAPDLGHEPQTIADLAEIGASLRLG
jgi:anion-transporting  ArsA/GET3 family ATPase